MTHSALQRFGLAGLLIGVCGAGALAWGGAALVLATNNAYQTPPASQEAEQLRQGIQKLIELERKLREEEAAKQAGVQAGGQAAQPPAAATQLTERVPQPVERVPQPVPARAAPGLLPPPGSPDAAAAANPPVDPNAQVGPPANLATTAPTEVGVAVAAPPGEELVGPPANFRLYRPNRRRTGELTTPPAATSPQDTPAVGTPAAQTPVAKPVVPADGKTEWFNFAGVPWEDVVKHFAERLDKPMRNVDELVIGGELTYVNPKRFTMEEAIDELNMLMQDVGWRFVERDNYIEVIPLSEMAGSIPIERTYPSREAYIADLANLRRMDWVIVYYKPANQPAGQLIETFSDALPDHARISELQGTNKIKLVATVKDINRFFDLVELISLEPTDPRQIKVFEIQTNAAEVERMVRDLLDLPQASPFQPGVPRRTPNPRNPPGVVQQVGGQQPSSELPVVMTADERTNSLIVKATPAEMSQIEKLIRQIDIKPNLGEFKTEVVPIQFADAAEVARVLTSIFQQEQGQSAQPNWQAQRQMQIANQIRNRRVNPQQQVQQNQQVSPESIIVEGIFERAKKTVRIAADERTNSLIVYANDDGQQRVRDLLKIIDVEVPSNFLTIPIVNTDAAKIFPMVDQISQSLGGGAGATGRFGRARAVRVVLDEASNALHVLAEREDMNKIRDVIQGLDVAGAEMVRHVVYLDKLLPSKVAPMVQQLLTEQPGMVNTGGGMRGRRGVGIGAGSGAVSTAADAQVIPLDEARLLIVVCKEEDWTKVAETIEQWDAEAISDQPVFATYELQNGDATRIAALVDAFYRNYQHPVLGRTAVIVNAQGNAVLVQAVEPAQEEIQQLIARLDISDLTRIEVLRLQNADATEVAEQAQRLFGGASGGRSRGGGQPIAGEDTLIEAEPATNSLVVKADSASIEKIKDFALAQDLRVAQLVPEPRFYTPNFAKPREIAEAVNALFGGGGSAARGGRGGTAKRASAVNAYDTETQVIVEAPTEKHEQIANFIAQLDNPEGREVITTLVKMPGAPVAQIAGMMRQAFQERVKNQKAVAEFTADQTTETILITCTESLMPEVERLVADYKTMTSELVMQRVFRKLKFASAEEAAKWLEPQLQATVTTLLGTAAAKQVQVVPDTRTGRLLVYAPQVAVKEAMQLLEEYDVDVPNPLPVDNMFTDARRLPGLDVKSLATTLDTAFGNRPRADKLRARFTADEITESLVITSPKDWKAEIDTLISQFAAETENVAPEQRFYVVANADPAYIVQKLNDLLVSRVRQKRGNAIADRIKITADERGGRVVVSAPKLVHEEAAALVAELDEPATNVNQMRTVALKNIEAQQAFDVLQQVFQDKIQKQKTLKVTPDPVSNSIVVLGSDEDFNEISGWLTQQDEVGAGKKRDMRIFVLENSNTPDQIIDVLNERYTKRAAGQRSALGTEVAFQSLGTTRVIATAPTDQMPEIEALVKALDLASSEADLVTEFFDVAFADPTELATVVRQFYGEQRRTQGSKSQSVYVTVANNTLLVRAPASEMEEIRKVIAQADADVPTALEVKSYDLKVMSAEQVAQQVNFFLATVGTNTRRGEIRPFAYGEPQTNTLVVGAPRKYMPFIQGLISGIEAKQIPRGEPRSYPLQLVRAEAVQANVQAMLDAKVNETEAGRKTKTPVKVVADPGTNRLFIYAPENYQTLAKELVAMVDAEMATGEIVRIVQLERGDAVQLALTLTQMQTASGRLGQSAPKVVITSDAASNSVILRGLPKDVAEVQQHAAALEEKSDSVPDLRVFDLKFAGTEKVMEVLEPLFTGAAAAAGKGGAIRPVTFTEDADRARLIVTATKRQMSQIESIIQELDVNPYNADGSRKEDSGKQIYFVDIYRGDAFDIEWDVKGLFPDEDEGGPEIDADWDGRYIKVKCRPGEFPAVLKAIREVDARAKPERKVLIRNAPPASKADQVFSLLRGRMEGVDIKQAPVEEKQETMIEVLRPEAKQKKQESEARAIQRGANAEPPRTPRKRSGAGADARWRRGGAGFDGFIVMTLLLPNAAAQDAPVPPATQPAIETASGEPAAQERERPQIILRDGQMIISGPEKLVDEIEDALDLIEEDLTEGQVIRIFEFTHGDVNAAAEVLNIMFNDRQAGVNQLLQQQQLQQQQQQQQQQNQRRQQQGGDGDDKDGGRDGGRQGGGQGGGGGGIMDQVRNMIGGGPQGQQGGRRASRQAQGAQRIKIATDASHNYLIIKCDETDLPEIRRLLRELDIPPGESDIRVFQLVNVDAVEAAQNIKEVLKIDQARGRSGTGGAQPGRGAAGAAGGGQDMLQMLQAEMMSVPGVEGGAKIESVEIVPNKITNSLMVSAAPEAMRVIERLIDTLEDLEGRDVVGIYYYDLKSAKAEDVLPLLREIFEAAAGGGGTSPASLGPVTLSADPRGNKIIFTAQAKDAEAVTAQIQTLDVEGQFADAETKVLQYGNAATIAETVTRIFGTGAAGAGGGPGSGKSGASSTELVRIAAEPATNSITVWGPLEKRNQIFRKVTEFEDMSRRSFRDIGVIYADAEDIADKLNQMFGGARAARGGGDAAQAANAVVIVGDANAKKLLIKAPDAVYEQIQALVTQLDQPNQSLQFRTFAVKYADATLLVDKVKTAFIEYIAQLPRTAGGKPPFDPFTAVADPRTNSVTVVGSEETLGFVGKLLGEIDVATPQEQLKQFRVFGLDNADAVTVADAINAFALGGAAGPSGGNRSGQRPGVASGGSGGPVLAVSAVPEIALNAVMVHGKPEDIDIVEREVLQQIEQLGLRQEFDTLTTTQAPPSQVVAFVQQFFDAPAAAEGGRPGQGGAQRRGPKMIPNDTTNQIIVRGSPAQIEEVRDLVARFDEENLVRSTIKVRKLKPGRDVQQLANEAGRLVNEAEQQQATLAGRPARSVILGADEYSNAIIIAGDPTSFGQVDSIIDQLEMLGPPGNMTTRVIQLTNVSAEAAQNMITQVQNSRRGAGSSGRVNRRGTGGGGNFQGPFNFPGGFEGGPIRRQINPGGDFGGNRGDGNRGGDRRRGNRGAFNQNPGAPEPARRVAHGPSAPRGAPSASLLRDPRAALAGRRSDERACRAPTPFVATTLLGPLVLSILLTDDAVTAPDELASAPRLAQATRPRRESERVTRTRRAPTTQPAANEQPPPQEDRGRPRRARDSERPAAEPPADQTAEQAPPENASAPNAGQPPRDRAVRDRNGVPPLPAPPVPPPPPGRAATTSAPAAAADDAAASALPETAAVSGVLEADLSVQALGSKQIIVTGNEQDIAVIEQILRVMEQSAPQARIEIFSLQNAKAAAIAEVITRAMQQFVETSGTPGPEDRFSISAEPGSNSLIVSASDRNMEFIAELITQIDQPSVQGETQFKLVLLQNALASDVVQQLRPAMERLAQVRKVPTEAAPSVQPVDRSNGVLVIGTPHDIEEVTQLIEAMDVRIEEESAGSSFTRAEVVLIPLQNAVAEDVAKTLTDLIKEQQDLAQQAARGEGKQPYVRKLQLKIADGRELPELDLEKPIRVIAERGTNSLIVFSAAKNLEPLKAIVDVFDTLPSAPDILVRAFVLVHAQAEGVAELLTTVFTEGKGALRRPGQGPGDSFEAGMLPPAPTGPAAQGLPYNVSIASDTRSNTVVVIGQQDAVNLAAGLISELDKPTAQLGIEPHVIELKNVAASKLAERVQELLDKRKAALGAEGNEARDSAVVIPEDRSNLLVVFATQEMFEMINKLARDLDTAPSYTTIDTRLRVLEFADAAKLQRMLQELFDAKKEAEPGNEPKNTISIQADARTNALVLTGTRDYLAQAEDLIAGLDRAGVTGTVEVEVIPVEFNTPANVARIVQEMIDKSRTEEAQGTPVFLTSDPISRSLLVTASREDMEQIRRWVDLIDKPAEIGITTAIVPLQRGSAEEVAGRIDEVFQGGGTGGDEGETGLSVSHDAATNSIVIIGPPALVTEVQNLVRQLDTAEPTGGAQVRIFRLEQADAEQAAELLQNILEGSGGTGAGGGGGGGGATDAARQVLLIYERRNGRQELETFRALRSEIVVTADARTNSLVVTAPPASMPLIESLIAAIDVPPAADRIEVYPLRNSDAQQMAETLQELFDQQTGGGTRRTGGTTGGGGTSGDEERRLTFAGSGAAGREQITFSADIRTNSVIAAGTPGYLKLAEELIYRLDTQPIEDRKTIVYAPRNIVAAELATSIRDYSDAEQERLEALGEDISAQRKQEREITAIDNEDANRVILSYSPRFEGDVLEIIRELDQPPPQVSIETLIVEVTLDNSLELGLEFAFQDLQFARAAPGDTTSFDFVGGTDVGAAGSGGLGGFTFAITGQDFNFLFRTLQSEGRLQVLSRPHIVAMDNQEAVIKVVDDVPYISGTSTSIAGQITTQVAREEIGITLEVTPQINPDGFVRMEIRQEVSNLGTSSVPIAPGLNAPTFFRREAETTVTVRDGETVMLGGLITHRQENTEQKVPLVGDVPLLGALFRSQRDVNRKTELLVILTPRVIRGVEDFREESIYQRDRSGTLPGDILTSPFMNRLQVKPEEMTPPDSEGVFGPFETPAPRYTPYEDVGEVPVATDDFPPAPRRPIPSQGDSSTQPRVPTYDVPLPRRERAPDGPAQKTYDLPVPANYAKPRRS